MNITECYQECKAFNFTGMDYPFIISNLLDEDKHNAIAACLASFRQIANQIHDLLAENSIDEIDRNLVDGRMNNWLECISNARDQKPSSDPVCRALADTFAKFELPIEPWNDYHQALRYHLANVSIPDMETFNRYGLLSFGPPIQIFTHILCSIEKNDKYRLEINPAFLRDELAMLLYIVHILTDFQNDLTSTVDGFVYIPDEMLSKHELNMSSLLSLKDNPELTARFNHVIDELYHLGREYERGARERLIIVRGEIRKEEWFILDLLINIYSNFLHRVWEFPHSIFNGGYPIDRAMVFINALKLQKDFGLDFRTDLSKLLSDTAA